MQNRIKVLLIGSTHSKRVYMQKLDDSLNLNNSVTGSNSIIGVDFKLRKYNHCDFMIWDLCGQERFGYTNAASNVKDAHGIIFTSTAEKLLFLKQNSKLPSDILVLDYTGNENALEYLVLIQVNKVGASVKGKLFSSYDVIDNYPQEQQSIVLSTSSNLNANVKAVPVSEQDIAMAETLVKCDSIFFNSVHHLARKKKMENEIDKVFATEAGISNKR